MNNHERAKQIVEMMAGPWHGGGRRCMEEEIEKALDATEPDPKARPAFLGDRTEWLDIAGEWKGPAEVAIHDNPERLRHPDGAPVSRVVPMPREIKESQLLTLEELEDGESYLGVWKDGEIMGELRRSDFYTVTNPKNYIGYLPAPKIKRGE